MKRILRQINNIQSALRFFDGDGNPSDVSNLRGNVSNLRGDVSYYLRGDVSTLTGDVSNLTGDVSNLTGEVSYYLRGDVSNLTGDVSNLTGNVDDAEITEKERKNGINVSDLIEE